MEISRESSGDVVVLRLNGRLDANWCHSVEAALTAAVRGGEHRLQLDMGGVSYISSAGLRVLLTFFKQLRAINGLFGVIRPSEAVRSVLELSGLQMLMATGAAAIGVAEDHGMVHASPRARYEVFAAGAGAFRVETLGNPRMLQRGLDILPERSRRFGGHTVALGVGALGTRFEEGISRCGEFLAVAGVAAFQPADASSRPDYLLSEGALIPEGHLVLGLCGEGSFGTLIRFEAAPESRTVGVGELAGTALALSGAPAAVLVAISETAGLVGAALRQSPAPTAASSANRFEFPQIRDWLSFTGERAFRDSVSLMVGVIARPGSPFDPWLRPLGGDAAPLGHVHAAVFPYRPLRKGRLALTPSVTALFEGQSLQAVLHLLNDPRGFNGAGESECYRGAVWVAPILP